MTPTFAEFTAITGQPVFVVLEHIRYISTEGRVTYIDVGATSGALRVTESVADVLCMIDPENC